MKKGAAMDKNTEIRLLDEATEKMNEYVRLLVRSKKTEQADSFCEEKYARIATTGFFKRILAYFIQYDESEEVKVSAEPTGIYEFVNAKLPGRTQLVKNNVAR